MARKLSARDVRGIDRRRFLTGVGGAALALPMLRALSPREARGGGEIVAPKRIVIVHHFHGRMTGGAPAGDAVADNWSPGTSTGPLPATGDISPLLASIGDVRDRIVTIDGIDDLVRHMTGDPDGHRPANLTALTCVPPATQFTAGGASFDYEAGLLLRASSSQRASIVFPASASDPSRYAAFPFYGANGTPGYAVSTSPLEALVEVFGPPAPAEPPPTKTLKDRLVARRASILDAVAGEYTALSQKVGAEDRKQLEQHADFIRTLETHLGGSLNANCERPMESAIPQYDVFANPNGQLDATITPWQIENLVMCLACDVTRVAALHFFQTDNHSPFPSAFDGASPIPPEQLHTMIHESDNPDSSTAQVIRQGFGEIGMLYTRLIQRLSEVIDVDGNPLLDNTLVIWLSELGYGSHFNFNIPIVMAGMPSAFTEGQGRHVVLPQRHTMGDLFTKALAMVGLEGQTFGYQGRIGDSGVSQSDMAVWAGYGGTTGGAFVNADRPLHAGDFVL
jgi:hypothetical protein